MLRGHSLCCSVRHVAVFFPGEGYPSTTGIRADLVVRPVYCTKKYFFLFQIHTYSCQTANSLDFLSSHQTLLNAPHSSLRVPSSLTEISDSEPRQRHLPAASSDVCRRSSTSDYAQTSNPRVTLTCIHRMPPPKSWDVLAAFQVTRAEDLN